MTLNEKQCLDVIPELSKIYCEPFSDSSQIPTFLVSKLAREKVTVSLSGDAGDELFAGYNRHTWIPKIWSKVAPFPQFSRATLSTAMKSLPVGFYDKTFELLNSSLRRAGSRVYQVSDIIKKKSPYEVYDYLTTHWQESIVHGQDYTNLELPILSGEFSDFTTQMLYTDQVTYLPNDICTKVDRAAMRNSLETRVPFLDKRLVELSWRIPLEMKIKNGQGKHILRDLLFKRVPKEYYDGPKVGFAVPLENWLRNDLRAWADQFIQKNKLEDCGLNSKLILGKWNEHLAGKQNNQYLLWDVLMFMSWHKEYL